MNLYIAAVGKQLAISVKENLRSDALPTNFISFKIDQYLVSNEAGKISRCFDGLNFFVHL